MALIACAECGKQMSNNARSCPSCGSPSPAAVQAALASQSSPQQTVTQVVNVAVANQEKRWSPLIAAFLSFFIPGLGQLYKGQPINGIVWFIVVVIGYVAFIIPGIILHIFCIIGAASGNPRK